MGESNEKKSRLRQILVQIFCTKIGWLLISLLSAFIFGVIINSIGFSTYDSNTLTTTIATSTIFDGSGGGSLNRGLVQNIGDNSVFNMCTFNSVNLTNGWGVINGIGTNCKILNCRTTISTTIGIGNTQGYSISNNGVPVSIISVNNDLAEGVFGVINTDITLVEFTKNTYTSSTLPVAGVLQLKPTIDDFVYLMMDGDTQISPISNLVIGKTYRVMVEYVDDGGGTAWFFTFPVGMNPIVENEGAGYVLVQPTVSVPLPKYLIEFFNDGVQTWITVNKDFTGI